MARQLRRSWPGVKPKEKCNMRTTKLVQRCNGRHVGFYPEVELPFSMCYRVRSWGRGEQHLLRPPSKAHLLEEVEPLAVRDHA